MKYSPFHIILLAVFLISIVVATLIFGGIIPGLGGSSNANNVNVVLWGYLTERDMKPVIDSINGNHEGQFEVEYVFRPKETFTEQFVDALARGVGPDLIMVSDDMVVNNLNKIYSISYETLSARDYSSNYLDIADVYMYDQGIVALPLGVDPLMMYYNEDFYNNFGVVNPPTNWSAVISDINKLTQKSDQDIILKSGIAFGEIDNVHNFQHIIDMLIMQTGNEIAVKENNQIIAILDKNSEVAGVEAALRFYSSFSDRNKITYSWSESLEIDQNAFIKGDLANYFGFASEVQNIRTKNPNLNFNVSPVPQRGENTFRLTKGKVLGISIVENSSVKSTAYYVATVMANDAYAQRIANISNFTPAKRSLISQPEPSDPFSEVIYESAIFAKTWPIPDESEVENIYADLVRRFNRSEVSDTRSIIKTANQKLNLLFR